MAKIQYTQNAFSSGMVSIPIFVRSDLEAQRTGLSTLENAYVLPTGGIQRREGTKFISEISGKGRLISFGTATGESLIVLTDKLLSIYENDILTYTVETPWSETQLDNIQWTQNLNSLFLVHPDVAPYFLKTTKDIWQFQPWEFDKNESNFSLDPFFKFEDTNDISLTPNGTSGTFTVSVTSNYFTDEHIGSKLRFNGGEVYITTINSTDEITVNTTISLANQNTSNDWEEACFSSQRGFPISVSFYQNRLVIGGTTSLPNKVWLSKTGLPFNFDFGEGLDDEAITFSLLSERREQICTVFSGRHLQVLTSESEWMIKGYPLTPATIEVKKQTTVGSVEGHYIPPQTVEGSTIFIGQNKREIREFIYGEVEQSYQSYDLILLASHLMNSPLDQSYNDEKHQLFIVMETGDLAVFSYQKSLNINAWSTYTTQGNFKSIATVNGKTYTLVQRANSYYLECFSENVFVDSFKEFTETDTLSLPHLNGQNIMILADDFQFEETVEDNSILLEISKDNILAGLSYSHIIEPLPSLTQNGEISRGSRLIELKVNLQETMLLEITLGKQSHNIRLDDTGFTGTYRLKGLGYIENITQPLWRIESSDPHYFHLLGYTALVKTK